jgi:hypothetical protein
VAYACNPSYLGGRDQDHGSKPAPANSSRNPVSTIPNKKRASGVAQGVGLEFKPQYCKIIIIIIIIITEKSCRNSKT